MLKKHIKTITEYFIIFLFLFALMMIFMFPYPLHLWNSWPVHHDPAFHNTISWYTAKAFMSGHFFPDFNGRFYYPYGNTMCWDDCYMLQALLLTPFYLLTKNPVFSFNMSFLLFWALSGVTMYFFLNQLFKNKTAAFFGAFAFTLCPFRTSYYVENNMQMMWAIPLAMGFMVRFFKTHKPLCLLFFSFAFIGQAYTAWYYTIILMILTLLFIPLSILGKLYKPSRKDIFFGILCSMLIGLAVFPYAKPYMINNRESGMHRDLEMMDINSADITSYLAVREGNHSQTTSLVHSKNPFNSLSECILSPGYFIYGLGILFLILIFLRHRKRKTYPSWAKAVKILCGTGILLSLSTVIFFIANHNQMINWEFGDFHFRLKDITKPVNLLAFFWLGLLVISARFNTQEPSPAGFTRIRMVRILFFTGFIFFILSLGPYIKFWGEHIGKGFVYYLYDVFFPIKANRVYSRYGILVIFTFITFASMLMAWLRPFFRKKKFLYVLLCLGMFLTAGIEFIYSPYRFEKIEFNTPSPVYQWIKNNTSEDSVILEEPSNNPFTDSKYMFWTHVHGRTLLNGWSGFLSPILIDVALDLYGRLFPEENKGPFKDRDYKSDTYRTVYPLRYLIVHLDSPYFNETQKQKWENVFSQSPSFLKPLNRFNSDLLFEFIEEPLSFPVHKTFSGKFIRDKHYFKSIVQVPENEGIDKMKLILSIYEKKTHELPLNIGKTEEYKIQLDAEPYQVKPENLYMYYSYSLKPDFHLKPEYKIGATDTYLPADVEITSESLDTGNYCAIEINGMNYAIQERGLNVCAMNPKGEIIARECFDPLKTKDENKRAAEFLSGLPSGTLLLLAVKDDYSLMDETVNKALSDFGFTQTPLGLFRYSYLGIGIKGAKQGSVMEKSGHAPLKLSLGKKINPPSLLHFETSEN